MIVTVCQSVSNTVTTSLTIIFSTVNPTTSTTTNTTSLSKLVTVTAFVTLTTFCAFIYPCPPGTAASPRIFGPTLPVTYDIFQFYNPKKLYYTLNAGGNLLIYSSTDNFSVFEYPQIVDTYPEFYEIDLFEYPTEGQMLIRRHNYNCTYNVTIPGDSAAVLINTKVPGC